MPFALIIIAALLIVSGYKGTQQQLFDLVQSDFTGQGSFIYWLAAIAVVGGVGYIPAFKNFSNAFLILILLALVLNEQKSGANIFQNLTSALQEVSTAQPAPSTVSTTQTANTATTPATAVQATNPATGSNFELPSLQKSLSQSLPNIFGNVANTAGGAAGASDFIDNAVSLATSLVG